MTIRTAPREDSFLVELLQSGQLEAAVRELLGQHGPAVKHFLHGVFHTMHDHDLEEAIGDAALRISSRIDAFDPTRGSLRSWMRAIAQNALLDKLRKVQIRQIFDAEDVAVFDELPRVDETRSAHTSRLIEALRSCIGKLSPRRQDIILTGLASPDTLDKEIAERWDARPPAIAVTRNKTHKQLAACIEETMQ